MSKKIVELEKLLKVCNRVVDGAGIEVAGFEQNTSPRLKDSLAVLSAGLENGTMLASDASFLNKFGKTTSGAAATFSSLVSKTQEIGDLMLGLAGDAKLVRFHTPKAS